MQAKLAKLQSKNSELTDKNSVDYSAFQQELLKVRKELRDVRRNLNKDIDNLGSLLKFINIFLMPILLTVFIISFSFCIERNKKVNEKLIIITIVLMFLIVANILINNDKTLTEKNTLSFSGSTTLLNCL